MEKMKLNIQLFANTACTVSVKSITQDIANNSSTITIHGKLTTSSSTYNLEGGAYMQPIISNQPVVGSQTNSQTLTKKKFSINKSSSKEYDWEFTVYHNSNGSCTNLTIKINWYATSNTNGTVTLSGGYTPATIPRASDVTATDGTLDVTDDVSITITRKNSSFTHTLRYVCGTASDWIKDSNNKVDTSATWTPPLSLADQNQSGDTVQCKIYCQTYNGSTAIGSETETTITLTIPTLNPTASFSSAVDDNSYYNTYGVFLQNKSKITFTLSGTAQYSTINTYSWEVRQNSASGTLLASGSTSTVSYIPTISGTIYFKGTVTDKRGASATATKTLSITAYKTPTCSLAVSRTSSTTSSYTVAGSGTPISISGKTANVVNYVLKRGSTNIYSSSGSSLNHSGTDTIADQSYTYTLTASDTISGTIDTKIVTISTTFTLMNFNSTGYAMAIGKASEATGTDKLLEIALPTTFTEYIKNELVVDSIRSRNLCGFANITKSANGITVSVNNQKFSVTGTATSDTVIDIPLINNINANIGNIIKYFYSKSGTYTGIQTSLRKSNGDLAGVWSSDLINKSGSITSTATAFRIQINNGITVSANFYVMIETGETANGYVTYQTLNTNPNINNLLGETYSNVDLNNIVTTGIYYMTTNLTNSPDNLTYVYLFVMKSTSASDVMQIATRIGYDRIYIRSRNNQTWGSWARIDAPAEGTWTPKLNTTENIAPTVTYTTQRGSYKKMGNIVFFNFYIRAKITALNGTNNYATITGLPYGSNAIMIGEQSFPIGVLYNAISDNTNTTFSVQYSVIRIQKNYGTSAVPWVVTSSSYMEIGGSGFYFTE